MIPNRHLPSPGVSPELRLATVDDAEGVRAIYNAAVTGTTDTFDLVPRTVEEQRAWVIDHQGAHPAVVAVDEAGIAGFGSLSSYRSRPAYSTTVEDSVYVEASRRGHGVGKAILAELLRLATLQGFHAVMARIVDGNEVSIRLHSGCGFELVGTEREVGRKFGRWLDVVVMERLL